MREDAVLGQLDISQGNRWFYYRYNNEPPIPVDEITRSSSPVALFDALEPGYEESPPPSPEDAYEPDRPVAAEASGRRKGRTSMPSWDEIVFGAGARGDD